MTIYSQTALASRARIIIMRDVNVVARVHRGGEITLASASCSRSPHSYWSCTHWYNRMRRGPSTSPSRRHLAARQTLYRAACRPLRSSHISRSNRPLCARRAARGVFWPSGPDSSECGARGLSRGRIAICVRTRYRHLNGASASVFIVLLRRSCQDGLARTVPPADEDTPCCCSCPCQL